jgi:hypothetical protein
MAGQLGFNNPIVLKIEIGDGNKQCRNELSKENVEKQQFEHSVIMLLFKVVDIGGFDNFQIFCKHGH